MALPVGPEDLKKLKTFIDFVAGNPTILNFPQLAFVKDFIEKFGGKVPSGEFKMPAGGGCPFGGTKADDVKAEPKQTVPDEEEMESESDSESDLELDMEVALAADKEQDAIKSPNAVYLQESIECNRNKSKTKSRKLLKQCKRNINKTSVFVQETKQEEPISSEDEAYGINLVFEACNDESDPIDTAAEVIIKSERDFENFEQVNTDGFVDNDDSGEDFDDGNDFDANYQEVEEENDSDVDNLLDVVKPRRRRKLRNAKINFDSNNENYNEENYDKNAHMEEKLNRNVRRNIKISRKRCKTRSRKGLRNADDRDFWHSVFHKKKKKHPKSINCTDKCKHRCHQLQISESQRLAMCSEYWSLSREERKNYLLDYVESRHISKIRARSTSRISKGYTNAYFLKNDEGTKVRVCLNFFQRTFCIANNVIKSATQNRDRSEIKKSSSLINKAAKARTVKVPQSENCAEPEIEVTEICIERLSDPHEEQKTHQDDTVAESSMTGEQNLTQSEVVESSVTSIPASQTIKRSNTNKSRHIKKNRVPQPVKCDEICIMKCTQNFTEEQRSQICQHFWTMDYKRQKDFVLSKIETRDVESLTAEEYRTSTRAKRTFSNRYYFKGSRGNNVRVCANFFMATLCIGRHVINNALKYADRQTGSYAGEDRRGKHTPGNKIPDELVEDMKRYVESYPTWVPHKNYKTRFLDSSLSIQQMWRDYKRIREAEGRKYCSASFFRHSFHKEHRLAFLKPSSKHAQRVSAMKKDVFSARTEQKKTNNNISEFTGEEGGGYWIKPNGEILQQSMPQDHRSHLPDVSSKVKVTGTVTATGTETETGTATVTDSAIAIVGASSNVDSVHIQENVQIHASQTTAMSLQNRVVNSGPYYASTSYVQTVMNPAQMHGITSSNVPSFVGATHRYDDELQPAVFRML